MKPGSHCVLVDHVLKMLTSGVFVVAYSFLQLHSYSLAMSRCSAMAIPPYWVVCLLYNQHLDLLFITIMTITPPFPY